MLLRAYGGLEEGPIQVAEGRGIVIYYACFLRRVDDFLWCCVVDSGEGRWIE